MLVRNSPYYTAPIGTSNSCNAAFTENCGMVQRSGQQERNPPRSLRDKRQRMPPLSGKMKF